MPYFSASAFDARCVPDSVDGPGVRLTGLLKPLTRIVKITGVSSLWQAFDFSTNCPFPGGSRHESNAANGIRDARSRRPASVDGVGDDFCLNARIVLDVVQIGGMHRSFEVLGRCYRAARIGVFASERTDARSVKVRKPRFVSSTSARFSSSVMRRAAGATGVVPSKTISTVVTLNCSKYFLAPGRFPADMAKSRVELSRTNSSAWPCLSAWSNIKTTFSQA